MAEYDAETRLITLSFPGFAKVRRLVVYAEYADCRGRLIVLYFSRCFC